MNISIEKNMHGYWVISAINKRGLLVTRRYLYYTKREALADFKQELRETEQ